MKRLPEIGSFEVNRPMRLSLLATIITVIVSGCGTALVPSSTAEEQIPRQPTTISAPTSTVGEQKPILPTAASESDPILGDTQTRRIDKAKMVYVPAGEFVMGSDDEEVDYALQQCNVYGTNCQRRYFSVEMPMHTVVLEGYWLDKTEVTNNQYELCEQAGICGESECQVGNDNYPVVCVTWEQAAVYCRWAGGRLPTEAEWEYAARGPERSRYPWGNDFEGTYLNYCDTNCTLNKQDRGFDDGYNETAPVGSYPQGASWVGALDMSGNVWEMVADWNGEYLPEKRVNPTGPPSGARRVARGGSWHASPDHVRSALRTHMGTDQYVDHAGFRCAQSAP